MLNPSAPPFEPGQAWGLPVLPELPAALLEHIFSRVSCLATLGRACASNSSLAAAAAPALHQLWQRWEGFVARAERIDPYSSRTGAALPRAQQRAADRAVIVFALSASATKALPASLCNAQRKWVHARAGQLRILTQSHGDGAKRRLHMTKPEGWVMSWTPAPTPPPPYREPLTSRFDDDGWRPWRPRWRYDDDDDFDEGWTSSDEDSDEWL